MNKEIEKEGLSRNKSYSDNSTNKNFLVKRNNHSTFGLAGKLTLDINPNIN